MTPSERLALLNQAILAVRPHGMLSEAVLEPLQTLRDDLAAESASPPAEPPKAPFNPLLKVGVDATKPATSTTNVPTAK